MFDVPGSPAFSDVNNLIDDGTKTILNLFENGAKIYTNVASRVQAIRVLNSQLANNKTTVVNVDDPSKTNILAGLKLNKNQVLVIGAISILALSVFFARSK